MSKVAGCKRKLKTKTITEKYKILKEIKKENHLYPKKYGVRKQTLSGWLKEKTEIYLEVVKNKNSAKRVRMRLSPHEDVIYEDVLQSMFYVAFKCPTPKHSCVRYHFQG